MSFSNMKKNRSAVLNKIKEATQNPVKGAESIGDNRFWKLKVDKAGNGNAVIRFLPTPEGEDLPYAKYFSHFVQGPSGLYYSENCPTTFGKDCPVCESNRTLWGSGVDADKEIARKHKRKINYVTNVLVIRDPANPENEGKTFLYSYGVKINDIIMSQMNPEFDDEEPIIPFDFWEGADFKLRAKNVGGFRNYDSSSFVAQSCLSEDEQYLEKLYNGLYSLSEFTDPNKYKDFKELEVRWDKCMGKSNKITKNIGEIVDAPSSLKETTSASVRSTPVANYDDDDDNADVDSFFANLAEED